MAKVPHTQLILDAVKEKLEGIDGGASYNFNLHRNVTPLTMDIPAQYKFPGVMFGIHNEAPTENNDVSWVSNDLYEAHLNFDVWGWVQDKKQAQRDAQYLAHDIRTAIEADGTLGDTIVSLHWTGSDYWLTDDGRGVGVCVVKWRALYYVNRTDTTRSLT